MATSLHKVPEFAAVLNISEKTARDWIDQKRISVVRLGRAVRVPQSEIDRLIHEGTAPAARNTSSLQNAEQ
jgi:excisionase family DNA binding protein